jgi:histidine triad (HIT) family protein
MPPTIALTPLRSMAPIHVLLFSKEHVADLPTILIEHVPAAGELMRRAALIAHDLDLTVRGYRLAWNFGPDTKQRIMHPHLHLLGGAMLSDKLA